jgi:FimV-like protein
MPSHTNTSARLKQISAAVLLACLLPVGAQAASLGKLTVLSAIGQPLNAEIELLSVGAQEKQSLAVKLAPQQAFGKASVVFNPALTALQFSIETRGAGQVVHITSAEGFNEPAVDVLLELSAANTPRAVREYSFLLEPPRSTQANSAQIAAGADPKSSPATATADAKSNSKSDTKADPRADAKPAVKAVAAKGKGKPAAKSEYKVKAGDSLSAIASRLRAAGVSLDQMLVALYRANPDAFVGDNMSRMRAGAVLSVPDAAAANAVEKSDASSVVVAQAQDFNTYRNQLAGHVAGAPAKKNTEASHAAGGKITAKVEERKTPAGESKDKLQLSKSNADTGGMSSEDKIASDKAASEAASRIKDLEKNVNDLQRLLEIKNQNLAELNAQKNAPASAAAASPIAAGATATPPAPAPAVAPSVAPGVTASAAATAAAPATSPVATDAATPAATPPVAVSDPATPSPADATDAAVKADTPGDAAAQGATPQPSTAPKPTLAAPVPKPDFFEGWRDNPMLLPGGGLLALVLLAWAAYRARRNQTPPADQTIAGETAPVVPVAPVMPTSPVVPPDETVGAVTPVTTPVAQPEPMKAAGEEVVIPAAEEQIFAAATPVETFRDSPIMGDPLFATDETAAVAAAQAEAAEAQSRKEAEDAIKIDLSRMEEPAARTEMPPLPPLELGNLGFDLELDQGLHAPAKEETPSLDLDLAAALAAQPPVTPVEIESEKPLLESVPELGALRPGPVILPPAIDGLSLDLGDPDAPAGAGADDGSVDGAAAGVTAAVADEDERVEDDDETSSFAKEINTKLDLAEAYQEIGDKDGARELLDEVIKFGNRRQVGKATEMLGQIK